MISSEFRSQHKILFSAPILPKASDEVDFSLGWSAPTKIEFGDVVDLDGDGKATYHWEETGDRRSEGTGDARLTEPSIYAPSLDQLKAVAAKQGKEVLTSEDLPGGLYLSTTNVKLDNKEVKEKVPNVRDAAVLVAEHFDPEHPAARWAVDLSKNEFLIYS